MSSVSGTLRDFSDHLGDFLKMPGVISDSSSSNPFAQGLTNQHAPCPRPAVAGRGASVFGELWHPCTERASA